MDTVDYNSFGLIPVSQHGAYALINNNAISIIQLPNTEYIRVEVKRGDKFVIVHALGTADNQGNYTAPPFIITTNAGVITYHAMCLAVNNYEIEITTENLSTPTGYIYFNNVPLSNNDGGINDLIVYQVKGKNSLLHQAVQNELIMIIKKQLKEMSE